MAIHLPCFNEHKEDLRRQGGQQLALRIYDVTDINLVPKKYSGNLLMNWREWPADSG